MPPIRPLRALTLGLVLLLAVPGVAAAQELRPLMHGWEHYFSVTWDTVQRRGRVEVEGYVVNRSPYRINRIRVLVDSLDDANRIIDQKVGWVPGELPGDSRLYFSVVVPPAAQYRVRVFDYGRLESAQIMSP
jgi:hypothetical protein